MSQKHIYFGQKLKINLTIIATFAKRINIVEIRFWSRVKKKLFAIPTPHNFTISSCWGAPLFALGPCARIVRLGPIPNPHPPARGNDTLLTLKNFKTSLIHEHSFALSQF